MNTYHESAFGVDQYAYGSWSGYGCLQQTGTYDNSFGVNDSNHHSVHAHHQPSHVTMNRNDAPLQNINDRFRVNKYHVLISHVGHFRCAFSMDEHLADYLHPDARRPHGTANKHECHRLVKSRSTETIVDMHRIPPLSFSERYNHSTDKNNSSIDDSIRNNVRRDMLLPVVVHVDGSVRHVNSYSIAERCRAGPIKDSHIEQRCHISQFCTDISEPSVMLISNVKDSDEHCGTVARNCDDGSPLVATQNDHQRVTRASPVLPSWAALMISLAIGSSTDPLGRDSMATGSLDSGETLNSLIAERRLQNSIASSWTGNVASSLATIIANSGSPMTIDLSFQSEVATSNPQILISGKDITINGNGAVLDAGQKGRFFSLSSSAKLTLYSVTLQNGESSVSVGETVVSFSNSLVAISDSCWNFLTSPAARTWQLSLGNFHRTTEVQLLFGRHRRSTSTIARSRGTEHR